jgi:quercetin dioxygenase-like cupin family protein
MKLAFFSLVCGVMAVLKGDQAPVPVSQEPDHHLQLETPQIKIYDVVVPPGQQTLMHVHDKDYFFVDFGGATLRNQGAGQPEQDLILQDGEVRYSGKVTHRVRNIGKNPFHNLTVELIQPPSPASKPLPPAKNEAVVLENDRVRALQALLPPGGSTGLHSHPQRTLTIMVGTGSVRIEVQGGKQERSVRPGEFIWNEAGLTHSLSNAGKTPLQIIEVEVK